MTALDRVVPPSRSSEAPGKEVVSERLQTAHRDRDRAAVRHRDETSRQVAG